MFPIFVSTKLEFRLVRTILSFNLLPNCLLVDTRDFEFSRDICSNNQHHRNGLFRSVVGIVSSVHDGHRSYLFRSSCVLEPICYRRACILWLKFTQIPTIFIHFSLTLRPTKCRQIGKGGKISAICSRNSNFWFILWVCLCERLTLWKDLR